MACKCLCGERFTEERYLTRHQEKNCKLLQRRSKRALDTFEGSRKDATTSSKRRQVEQATHESNSLFMGRLRLGKRKGMVGVSSGATNRESVSVLFLSSLQYLLNATARSPIYQNPRAQHFLPHPLPIIHDLHSLHLPQSAYRGSRGKSGP